MIKMENIAPNILRVTIPETLKADDFAPFALQVDEIIRQNGTIRLLVDASDFNGWENLAAFEKHMGFVKSHQKSVERIAIIVGHSWQHWVAGVFKIFVRPEIRVFDKNEVADSMQADAMQWVND